jgi:hypothetical protein
MRARAIPVCPEKTDEADGGADDEILASHRVFGIVRSIDPRDLPLLPLRHLVSSQKDRMKADDTCLSLLFCGSLSVPSSTSAPYRVDRQTMSLMFDFAVNRPVRFRDRTLRLGHHRWKHCS